ncbi:MAG: HrpE/YscL family type III secretion apparatus protein [Puniceicoccales bacterium]|jgi:type III secretion protein L|nr:HrpE/YscL family type III secretion apparatus protein [Puniceicoccales bacterium]
MLHISREKFQLLPEKKILKREDYCAYLEAEKAIEHAYRENDHLIQYASQLCDKLVKDTNHQIASFVEVANVRANELIETANQNAAQTIGEANEKSEAILEEAVKKREQIFGEAKKYYESEAKRGYEEGYSTGKSEMTQQLIEVAAKNSENFKQLENSIVGLVIKALQRVVGDFDRKELIVDIVRQALKMVKNQREAVLKVSPQDSQAVRDRLREILSDGSVDYLEVMPDSRLKPGTCILETDIGVVDASLDVQLESITKAFKKAMPDSVILEADGDKSAEKSDSSAENNGEVAPPEMGETGAEVSGEAQTDTSEEKENPDG